MFSTERLEREIAALQIDEQAAREVTSPRESAGPLKALPLVLAGPIVRRASPQKVWYWLACSRPVEGVRARIAAYDQRAVTARLEPGRREIAVRVLDLKVVRMGERIWIVLVAITPESGAFPTDTTLGYDLALTTPGTKSTDSTWLSLLGLKIAYAPFSLPTFVLGNSNRYLAHGSCRRPGADARDALEFYDGWLAKQIVDPKKRPGSLILTGDQIYADDVAVPLFEAVRRLAYDVFGYTEQLPNASGQGTSSADSFSWKDMPAGAGSGSRGDPRSGRKRLTHRKTSSIGFTTEDGEAHLLSLPEFAAMYLIVWCPDLCEQYKVESPGAKALAGFCRATRACRRVMANTATYMLCDDHEITDDWNLDQSWQDATQRNPLGRRIIANGLAAYWAFQAWGNDPETFDSRFLQDLELYWEQLRTSGGLPRTLHSRSPYHAAEVFEKRLLGTHWSFMTASTPPALCVDTRTQRETPATKDSAILSGPRVWRYIDPLLRKAGFRPGGQLVLVLPTPLIPHYSMMKAQAHEYGDTQSQLHARRYEAEFELYANNPRQRAQLVLHLHKEFAPASLLIFSGDVHHGSVVTGRYAYGAKLADIRAGKADWSMGIVQVTSSPIKNEKNIAYRKKRWWTAFQTDAGNVGEEILSLWEHRYAAVDGGASHIAMQAKVRRLKGALGRETYVFEPHLCVVRVPGSPNQPIDVVFVGEKGGALQTASASVATDNDPAKFKVKTVKVSGKTVTLPPED